MMTEIPGWKMKITKIKVTVKMTTSMQQEKARIMIMSGILKRIKQARRKERRSFPACCEVLKEYIEFDEEGQSVNFKKQQMPNKTHKAQKRLVEIDAIRREHQ